MGIHDPVDHLDCPEQVRRDGHEPLWDFLVTALANLGSLTRADSIYLECLLRPLTHYHSAAREAAATDDPQAREVIGEIASQSLKDARQVFEEYQEHAFAGFGARWDDWARLWNDLVTWDHGNH